MGDPYDYRNQTPGRFVPQSPDETGGIYVDTRQYDSLEPWSYDESTAILRDQIDKGNMHPRNRDLWVKPNPSIQYWDRTYNNGITWGPQKSPLDDDLHRNVGGYLTSPVNSGYLDNSGPGGFRWLKSSRANFPPPEVDPRPDFYGPQPKPPGYHTIQVPECNHKKEGFGSQKNSDQKTSVDNRTILLVIFFVLIIVVGMCMFQRPTVLLVGNSSSTDGSVSGGGDCGCGE